jgi:hypothetical protein
MTRSPVDDGLLRCDGTLVVHADGGMECTEPYCDECDPIGHRLVLDCDDIDGGCNCEHTAVVAAELAG